MAIVSALCLSVFALRMVPAAAHDDGMAGMAMGHAHADAFSFGSPAKPSDASRTIRITMGDMSFEPSSISVQAGEVVRFVITNTSSIEHEFNLGDAASEADHRKEMLAMMEHGHGMSHDDPNAITVKPGQTRDLTWKFGHHGTLEYDCNIPGHYEGGMRGSIRVQ